MSIKKIAERAEVGICTVSRYLNTPERVAEKTARRIRQAMDELGFELSPNRPGPKSGNRVGIRTGKIVIAIVGPTPPQEVTKRPIFAKFFNLMQFNLHCRQLSHSVVHIEPGKEFPEGINRNTCDGVILFGDPADPAEFARLEEHLAGLPAVYTITGAHREQHNFDLVCCNNGRVGILAAEYLYCRGHRQAVAFTHDLENADYLERIATFNNRAIELGMRVEQITIRAEHRFESERRRFRRLAEWYNVPELTYATGLFFPADWHLLGCCLEFARRGIDLDRLDMIGCDSDPDIRRYFEPYPASIDLRYDVLGQETVAQLLRRINGDKSPERREIFLDPLLVPKEYEYEH